VRAVTTTRLGPRTSVDITGSTRGLGQLCCAAHDQVVVVWQHEGPSRFTREYVLEHGAQVPHQLTVRSRAPVVGDACTVCTHQ